MRCQSIVFDPDRDDFLQDCRRPAVWIIVRKSVIPGQASTPPRRYCGSCADAIPKSWIKSKARIR